MADVTLTASIRSNLLSLNKTSRQMDQTTERLSTGKKVSSAVDNPTNYFAALNYSDRANGLSDRLDGMSEAVQTINAADNGITTLKGFLSQMKGVINNALGEADSTSRQNLGKQYNELINQAQQMVKDSSYGGINLMNSTDASSNGDTLTVQFGDNIDDSKLDISGFNIQSGTYDSANAEFSAANTNAAGGSGDATSSVMTINVGGTAVGIKGASSSSSNSAFSVDWAGTDYKTTLKQSVQDIETLDNTLSTQASSLANNLAVITQRQDFTNQQINILKEGSDNLTLADLNEEGANLLSLQTSQQLGIQSLSLASQQNQAVLSIIR